MIHPGQRKVHGGIAAIPAIAIVSLVGLGIAAADGSPGLPAEKAAAIANEKPPNSTEQQLLASVAASPQPAAKKPRLLGKQRMLSITERESVVTSAQSLITRDYLLLAAPAQSEARRAFLADAADVAGLKSEIAAIWVSDQVVDRTSDVMANLQLQAHDASVLTFDAVHLKATGTPYVATDGVGALVTLTGHFDHDRRRGYMGVGECRDLDRLDDTSLRNLEAELQHNL